MTITLDWDLLAWFILLVAGVYAMAFTVMVLVLDPIVPEWLVPALGLAAVTGAVVWAVVTVAT